MDEATAPLAAAADGVTELPDPHFDPLTDENPHMNLIHAFNTNESASVPQQQPTCDASEVPAIQHNTSPPSALLVATTGAPDLRRSSSTGGVAAIRTVGYGIGPGIGRRSRSRSGGDDGDRASSELVLQLQRLCRRQRQRSEERAFVRDVERVLALLRVQTPTSTASDVTSATFPGVSVRERDMLGSVREEDEAVGDERRSSVASSSSTFSSMNSGDRTQMSRVMLTLAEIDTLLDCIGDLFDHRNPDVRTLAFEVVQLCLLRFGERLTPALRRKIYLRLETHPAGDFLLRQKALRALTQDGRHLEPFNVELGWFLLRLLEQSDAQRDLLGLIQSILRRSPRALDRDKVIAVVSVISARCDMAWSRSDLDACRRFVAFFHVLAVHDLAYAASTPACLRSLCCLVNADGHGTWSAMKLLLSGSSGFLVLRGLLQVLEHPSGVNSPWVLRGGVFFVGMSCWGSQRVAKFDDIAWAPILLALEQALQCCRGVVIFEVILSLQRLIKKFGASGGVGQQALSSVVKPSSQSGGNGADADTSSASSTPNASNNRDKRRLVMEWDIILRMLQTLRPWVSMTDENEIEEAPQRTTFDSRKPEVHHRSAAIHPADDLPDQQQQQLSVSIQQTRIPRELLDTLLAVEELVEQRQFAGDVDEFLCVLEDYLPHLSETSMLFLLRQRAEAAHPGYHLDWLSTLSAAMRTFFSCISADGDSLPIPSTVRLEALEVLRLNLRTSRNVCEDRVIEEVVIPTLGRVYEDPDSEVRHRALGFIIDVSRQLESLKFDSLLDILANAMTLSSNEDAQLVAVSGIVTLFSCAFDHLPPSRAVRMYDLLATTVETHRSRAVRYVALTCLLSVCEARATDGKLQWKELQQVRTSRFLFVSRRAARINASGVQLTAACVLVARALRALLTLVSAEADAELFRMAVQGTKTMLENRTILEDVDVSEVSAKLVASIDYRAFGRAAISDEVDRLFSDQTNDQQASDANAAALVPRDQKSRECKQSSRPIPLTDADLVRSIHVSTRTVDAGPASNTEASFCASVRATAALVAKTRFLAMGIELLQLLVSYEAELQENALRELARCLIGSMELRLAVAEKDLFASAAVDEPTLSSSASSPNMLYRHGATRSHLADAASYVPDTPLNFTSRVLSRFQTSASHGNLFHALSGSGSKLTGPASAPTPARPSRKDRVRLREFLRQLFDSEFKLLHTTTTALSLLTLLAPVSILGQLDDLLQNLRGSVTTVDGDFRPDAFVAVLELLTTIMTMLARERGEHELPARKAIVEILLLGFEYAKSKQLAYLSFRLLCQVIHQSGRRERVVLGTLAMPTLQACTRRANSLLVEAAVDFVMCFAYSQSEVNPSALCSRQESGKEASETRSGSGGGDSSMTRSRSWVYRRSLLTITTNSRGDATLIIRRANCTSRWDLNACHDFSLSSTNPAPLYSRRRVDERVDQAGRGAARNSFQSLNQRPEQQRGSGTPKRRSLPAELRPSYSNPSSLRTGGSTQLREHLTRLEENAEDSYRETESYEEKTVEADDEREETGSSQTVSALPPLPAYDGIGGSPSYYCESAQVRREPQRNTGRSTSKGSRSSSRQEEGDDGKESSPGRKPAIRVIREDVEEYDDETHDIEDHDTMDAFSLDDSISISSSIPEVTPRILQFVERSNDSDTEPSTVSKGEEYDPTYLMMQLFDLSMENRPQLLSDGPQLMLALSVLDRTPEYETHKIGLLYVRDEKQSSESAILGNSGGSLRYLRFLRGLGTFTKLEGLPGYTGGLDTANNTDGRFGLVYKDACAQIMFHVATMMIPQGNPSVRSGSSGTFASMKKKRHIGNDFVHVVFKECDEDYDLQTLSGQFNDVHIVIQPLNDLEYRTEVHIKPGISPFGPLYGRQIVSSSIISESVRLTCLNANLACQVFHQDLVGFALNCEDRLKQIKQLGLRLATTDEWKLD